MKKFSFASVIAILASLIFVAAAFALAFALFSNGNFESGDWTGWNRTYFLNSWSERDRTV